MFRLSVFVSVLVLMLSAVVPAQAQTAPTAAPCQFILGFKSLHDMDPADIGDCMDNQAFADNGDAQQHTTKGLMAWRKADNYTAFTNGYMTWINGPGGLVSRLNTVRFPWESTAPISTPVPSGTSSSSGTPAATPTPSGTPGPSATVIITDNGFQPETANIVTGGSVTWINEGTRTHSASSVPGQAPLPFDTGGLNPKQSTSLRFGQPGIYNYISQPDCLSGNQPGFNCKSYTVSAVGPKVQF